MIRLVLLFAILALPNAAHSETAANYQQSLDQAFAKAAETGCT